METDLAIDISLFGVSPEMGVYDGLSACGAGFAGGAAAVLDTKAAGPGDPFLDMQAMLLEMTKELRERFQRFQRQKVLAERDADGAEDEATRKVAQTDAKAAIEAVSLIVRTLEKIDSLQRQLARDREDAALLSGEGEDEEAIREELLRIIESQAEARAKARLVAWQNAAAGAAAAGIGGAIEPASTPDAGSG